MRERRQGEFGKKRKTYLAKMAALSLLLGALMGDFSPAKAVDYSKYTSASIKEKESQISNAQNEKAQIQSSLTDVKALKSKLESTKKNLENYVETLDASLTEMQEKIDMLNGKITEKEEEIAKTEAELDEAIRVQNEQYEAMKKRIKFMYERGDNFAFDMVMHSESFGDMLNKFDYIQQLSSYDKSKLEEYTNTSLYVEACKEQLDAEKDVLETARTEVKEEEAAMEVLISEKESEISSYTADIQNQSAAIKEYEAQIAAQNEIITTLERAVAEERRKLAAADMKLRKYDGGVFCFPAPSYTRISDDYGNRIHPTLHVQQFHNGVDLAAPSGSPILAAYDGEVVAAAYSATMGNYIMLDHGDSLYTIYMHSSKLYVSKGDTVVKGQQIAAVGSTGRSTGPHLHFSVRQNGSYVSPWNFLQ